MSRFHYNKCRSPFKKLLSNCKISGRRRFLYNNGEQPKLLITEKDIAQVWAEQSGKCFWFDVSLDLGLLYRDHHDWLPFHPMAPSVDRKDDKGEYTKENIVICCRFANLGRCVYPFDKMRHLVETLKGNAKNNKLEDFMG